ncbi:MAG: hypothetical protein DI556_15260 [Rhodovulum sulfidophilum]|uniref:Putative 4-hydroxy-4-methyl-2-oxoglutarate aldolase n=1 Tax=Rhodovulum sulfidophilum TaxID=35806 RepID=A0A2W5N6E7_RHOSU|nr:MAG: hypothetical protein DI556_15260 [Rhodovulum sulfidophilum]
MPETTPIRTTHLADAADALGCDMSAGGFGLRWAGGPEASVSGRAFTLAQRPIRSRADCDKPLRHPEVALSLAQPGDIIVMSVEGDTQGATWGEAHSLRAFNRGVAGVLLDGLTRDAGTLHHHRMPVLYRGTSPLRSAGRLYTASVNADARIGGTLVRNGDFVMLDGDGFVAIAAAEAEAVLARAREIADKEAARNSQLLAG